MKVTDRIELLIAEADKLRPLHNDDPAKLPLGAIVDEINELRAVMAAPGFSDDESETTKTRAEDILKPGRKPRAVIEGADAQ